MSPAVPTWAGVAASLALVAVAVAWRQRLHLAREITIAAAQLTAVSAVLLLVFQHAGLAEAAGWLALMVAIAGQVAARRARGLPGALPTAAAAIAAATATATATAMGSLLALGVISTQARVVIPAGGMIVSGAMVATAVTLTRIRDEAAAARPAIEDPCPSASPPPRRSLPTCTPRCAPPSSPPSTRPRPSA